MYICNDCGATFTEPRNCTKTLSVGLCHYTGCPSCEGDDFEKTEKKCPFTDEYIHPSKDLSDGAKQRITDDLTAVLENHCGAWKSKQKEVFLQVVEEWLEAAL